MKKLLTGNEAITLGAYEAGVSFACAYPGTPSTEILETISEHKDIIAEWAPNEKVALEAAIGASIAGARSLSAMKMVGVNVAADPLMSFVYTGVNGGMVLVSADDPGLHSSQNEQDNRYFAKFGKLAMFEPSSSQECKDMMIAAYEISEAYDTPILFRVTTRICHSKGIVEARERRPQTKKPYVKNLQKYDLVPAVSRRLHYVLENKLKALEEYSNTSQFNSVEFNNRQIGIIVSGVSYQYAREVFGDTASYLKIGFTNPLPMEKIRAFAREVGTLYVIEELEPYMEERIKAAGIPCIGKEKIPVCGELNPGIISRALLGVETPQISYDESVVAARPPLFSVGCLKADGTVIVNDHRIPSATTLIGKQKYPEKVPETLREKASTTLIDAHAIAAGLGNSKAMNVVLFGALIKAMKLFDIDWEKEIARFVKPAFLDLNLHAFKAGMAM